MRISPKVFFLFLLLLPFSAQAQKITKFQEYSSLKETLADAKVILLGEESHADLATMNEKVELIKYLHDSLDFDLLLFESSLYDMHQANEQLTNGGNGHEALLSGIYDVWHQTTAIQDLAEYLETVRDRGDTLYLGGFDSQFYSGIHFPKLTVDLAKYLRSAQIPFSKEYIDQLHQEIMSIGEHYALSDNFTDHHRRRTALCQ